MSRYSSHVPVDRDARASSTLSTVLSDVGRASAGRAATRGIILRSSEWRSALAARYALERFVVRFDERLVDVVQDSGPTAWSAHVELRDGFDGA